MAEENWFCDAAGESIGTKNTRPRQLRQRHWRLQPQQQRFSHIAASLPNEVAHAVVRNWPLTTKGMIERYQCRRDQTFWSPHNL
eukprot:1455687-Pleurochrysis_carterae.AAC.1